MSHLPPGWARRLHLQELTTSAFPRQRLPYVVPRLRMCTKSQAEGRVTNSSRAGTAGCRELGPGRPVRPPSSTGADSRGPGKSGTSPCYPLPSGDMGYAHLPQRVVVGQVPAPGAGPEITCQLLPSLSWGPFLGFICKPGALCVGRVAPRRRRGGQAVSPRPAACGWSPPGTSLLAPEQGKRDNSKELAGQCYQLAASSKRY